MKFAVSESDLCIIRIVDNKDVNIPGEEILVTGAEEMNGRMVCRLLKEVGRTVAAVAGIPEEIAINGRTEPFEAVIHCAGNDSEGMCVEINLNGTRRLLKMLEARPPRAFVYISSAKVYGDFAGKGIAESACLRPSDEIGKSYALAEREITAWAEKHGVILTVLRPALTFGPGVKGEMLRLFNQVVSGRYIHIRGNEAQVSLVTAYDLARAAILLSGQPGVYNVSDGRDVTLIQLCEAMSANAGARRRMTHLPAKWADLAFRFFRWLPIVNEQLSPSVRRRRETSLTLDSSRLKADTDMDFFDTLSVIARENKDYPYEDA